MLPGFIDSHLHPVLMIYFDMNVNLFAVPSIAELQRVLRETAARKAPGAWVIGSTSTSSISIVPYSPQGTISTAPAPITPRSSSNTTAIC